jgi:hypothetical protein
MNKTTFLVCALVSAGAFAQAPAPQKAPVQTDLGANQPTTVDRPWAKAVSPGEQRLATDLFREGNALLKESLFVQAAEKYREALRHWNHPGIHYNLALALLNLDQPVEVFLQLEEAMKYGNAPLDADKYEHAGRYKALIEKQLARVEITCGGNGAEVSMDGRRLFTSPGRYEALTRVGQHTIVATKTGYVSTQKEPVLPPGQKTTIDLQLFTADELTHYKRRWHNAIPWSVLAGGIAIAGAGGIMHWQASENFSAYDKGVNQCSMMGTSGGCNPDAGLAGKKSTGESLQVAAIASYAIGGAAIAVGGTLLFLNRQRPFRVNPEGGDTNKLTVVPMIGPGGGGVVATIRF